nr:cancer-associated gene 1 protein homolog [Macaca nemestrina]
MTEQSYLDRVNLILASLPLAGCHPCCPGSSSPRGLPPLLCQINFGCGGCWITKLGCLLESKESHCNRLIEENDKYQRHLGSLIKKVTSYEEIIECADQRLAISHSQIAHLEKRNKHLEDLIRKPREKARKPRSKSLENHPKSMTMMPAVFKENRNDLD